MPRAGSHPPAPAPGAGATDPRDDHRGDHRDQPLSPLGADIADRFRQIPGLHRIITLGEGTYRAEIRMPSFLRRWVRGWRRSTLTFPVTSEEVEGGRIGMWPVGDDTDILFVVDNRLDPLDARREFEEVFADLTEWVLTLNTEHSMIPAELRYAGAGQLAAFLASASTAIPDRAGRLRMVGPVRAARTASDGFIKPWNTNDWR